MDIEQQPIRLHLGVLNDCKFNWNIGWLYIHDVRFNSWNTLRTYNSWFVDNVRWTCFNALFFTLLQGV